MHCKIAFAGTDVAFHILVTLRGAGGENRGERRRDCKREERKRWRSEDTKPTKLLSRFASVSITQVTLGELGMAWGRDVIVI